MFLKCLLSARPQARFLDSSCDEHAVLVSGVSHDSTVGGRVLGTFRNIISTHLIRNLGRQVLFTHREEGARKRGPPELPRPEGGARGAGGPSLPGPPAPSLPCWQGHLVLPLPLSVVLAHIFHLLQCHNSHAYNSSRVTSTQYTVKEAPFLVFELTSLTPSPFYMVGILGT